MRRIDGYERIEKEQLDALLAGERFLTDSTTEAANFRQQMRRTAFDAYFAAVRGMTLHPGTTRDSAPNWTLEQVRDEALQMLDIRDQLVAEGRL